MMMVCPSGTFPVSIVDRHDGHATCPACGHSGLKIFFFAHRIPVHTVLLMDSADEARAYPQRDLELGLCPHCGFVTNTLFDEKAHEYSEKYEETQGFSERFREFMDGVCRDLIDRYQLDATSNVVEVGCGKGEFLAHLCELSGASGVGIDPSYVPGRLESSALERLSFDQSFYGPEHRDIKADLICCRHTLEHIAQPREFLNRLAANTGEGESLTLFFELPDLGRILKEGAYWDIYYEHCSYFTPGSLARLFRGCGFRPTRLQVVYQDQYILIDAVRDESAADASPLPQEEDLGWLEGLVEGFRQEVKRTLSRWRSRINERVEAGQRLVLWGGGSKAVAFIGALGLGREVSAVIDINPHKVGRYLPGSGHAVVADEELLNLQPQVVIVMNPVYRDEISRRLEELGIEAELWSA